MLVWCGVGGVMWWVWCELGSVCGEYGVWWVVGVEGGGGSEWVWMKMSYLSFTALTTSHQFSQLHNFTSLLPNSITSTNFSKLQYSHSTLLNPFKSPLTTFQTFHPPPFLLIRPLFPLMRVVKHLGGARGEEGGDCKGRAHTKR